MKVEVCFKSDFDNEVMDVMLRIVDEGEVRDVWVKGFDEDEWEKVNPYANKLAAALGIEYIGEVVDEYEEEKDYD